MIFITMKRMLSTAIFLFIAGVAFTQPGKKILITNPSPMERKDELIVLSRGFLEQKTGKIPAGKFISLETKTKDPLVVQFDDTNGDGTWDEAVFLYTFKAKESVSLTASIVNENNTDNAVVRAHVRQKHKMEDDSFGPSVSKDTMPYNNQPTDFSKHLLPPYLTEGPAWENDKAGFRIYFDVRNAKDLWGKTTEKMMMDEVGVNPSVIYHHLAPWGMDILKVGQSLGAGSLALWVPLHNGKDSLVRLGGKNIQQAVYEKIADGPVRALFRLHYKGWKIADDLLPVNVTEEVSIWGGQYFYESKVTVKNAPAAAKLVTGIVNYYSKQSHIIDTASAKALYTFDVQSENHDKLGLGIMMKDKFSPSFGQTPDSNTAVQNTYIVLAKIPLKKPVAFRFYSCWERSDENFTTENAFSKYFKSELIKYAQPITIH